MKTKVISITLLAGILSFMVPGVVAAQSPWPMFQHDAQHTGRSPFIGPQALEEPETQIQILIEGEKEGDIYGRGGDHFGTPVISSDGTLYLIARITRSGQTKEGLWAFTSDGIQKWVYEITSPFNSMPALWEPNSTVYIAPRGGLLAIDCENGGLKWSKTGFLDSKSQNLIVSENGVLYFVAEIPDQPSDWGLYAIDDKGQILWVFPIGPPETDLTIGKQGDIYFGQGDTLFALSPDGTEKWEKTFEADRGSSTVRTPSIADDGTIYVIVCSEKYSEKSGWTYDCLHAVDFNNPEDEKLLSVGFLEGIPAIASSGNVYITRTHSSWGVWMTQVYGFDSQGNSWSSERAPQYGGLGPLLVDNAETIYVFFDNMVRAFSPQLELKWSAVLGYRDGPLSLGQDGTLYVGGQKKLYAIGPYSEWEEPPVGYAIIVAGQDKGSLWPPKPNQKFAIDHSANNAYRVLRNLGFDDDHIFYLNDEYQQIDGQNVVDKSASFVNLSNSIDEIKREIEGSGAPLIVYLVGHGIKDVFDFYTESDALSSTDLREMLEAFDNTPMLIVIGSCYSGSFITIDGIGDSISADNRIIITAAHDKGFFGERTSILGLGGWYHSSDRFWGNLNKGLNVKDAFITNAWPGERLWLWLDDNGDAKGNPPNDLKDDGELSGRTTIGIPGTEDLELTDWYSVWIHSAGEVRVYDSQNRVTGLVNGEIREEIPGSIYDEQNEIVAIFDPYDVYCYEVLSTGEGVYGLDIGSIKGGETKVFTAIDIPTSPDVLHQYTIDWEALSAGEAGATLRIDADGDGVFETTITADDDLTCEEFILQTETTIDFEPDTLNLKSKGEFVTAYIELPAGFDVSQIDVSSIMVNNLVPALVKPTGIGDYDKDGTPDLMVKFKRDMVQSVLSPGEGISIVISGQVFHNGSYFDFEGKDTIEVINP